MAGFTEKEALNELVGSGTAIPKINMKFDSNNNSVVTLEYGGYDTSKRLREVVGGSAGIFRAGSNIVLGKAFVTPEGYE